MNQPLSRQQFATDTGQRMNSYEDYARCFLKWVNVRSQESLAAASL